MSNSFATLTFLAAEVVLAGAAAAPAAERFDIVLKGGRVVDGSGAPWYSADVGIRDGRIVAIGRLTGGEEQ